MWQKFIAGACVMTGALGFGWSLCREMSSEIEQLKLQKQILLYIIGEITYLHRPLDEIFDMVSDKTQAPYDAFLKDISQKMKEREGRSLVNIWSDAIHNMPKRAELSQISIGYLRRMGNCFECEGNNLQTGTLELLGLELDSEIDRLTEKKEENSRLIRALSTLTGILCIILFL